MEPNGNKIKFNFSSLRKTLRKEPDGKSTYSAPSGDTREESDDRFSSDDDYFSITHHNRPQKIYRSIKKRFKSVLCKSKQKVTATENKCSQMGFVSPELVFSLGEVNSQVYYPPVPPRQMLWIESNGSNSHASEPSNQCNSSLIVCASARLNNHDINDDFLMTSTALSRNSCTPQLRYSVDISSRQVNLMNDSVESEDFLPSIISSHSMNIACTQNDLIESQRTDAMAGSSPSSSSKNLRSNTFGSDYSSLKRHGYYWGPISRLEAEDKLSNQPDGTFLIRDSSSDNHLFSLTFRSWGKTLHSRIEYTGGTYSICDQDGYKTIVELIEQVMNSSNNSVYCYSRSRTPTDPVYPVRLTSPCHDSPNCIH